MRLGTERKNIKVHSSQSNFTVGPNPSWALFVLCSVQIAKKLQSAMHSLPRMSRRSKLWWDGVCDWLTARCLLVSVQSSGLVQLLLQPQSAWRQEAYLSSKTSLTVMSFVSAETGPRTKCMTVTLQALGISCDSHRVHSLEEQMHIDNRSRGLLKAHYHYGAFSWKCCF